mmetsp:Transcript_722/g.1695  ORF Transcript_722/g.1695 Transcript_722/m.1695 type:complete len:204 (-) Transcript_722:165-776(-)
MDANPGRVCGSIHSTSYNIDCHDLPDWWCGIPCGNLSSRVGSAFFGSFDNNLQLVDSNVCETLATHREAPERWKLTTVALPEDYSVPLGQHCHLDATDYSLHGNTWNEKPRCDPHNLFYSLVGIVVDTALEIARYHKQPEKACSWSACQDPSSDEPVFSGNPLQPWRALHGFHKGAVCVLFLFGVVPGGLLYLFCDSGYSILC